MAHREHVLSAHRLAFVELFGRVDRSDLFDVLRSLQEKGWEASFNVLCEATGVRELVLRPGELEKLVTMLNEPNAQQEESDRQPHGTVAVVVQRPLDYSAASLYKELAAQHGFRVEVCWSRKKAYQHLGLDGLSEAIERVLQRS